MIHDDDYSGHKTWRLIYAALFIANLILMPSIAGALFTAIIALIIALLFWGQQKAIDEIESRRS
jgi:hypothetical protein